MSNNTSHHKIWDIIHFSLIAPPVDINPFFISYLFRLLFFSQQMLPYSMIVQLIPEQVSDYFAPQACTQKIRISRCLRGAVLTKRHRRRTTLQGIIAFPYPISRLKWLPPKNVYEFRLLSARRKFWRWNPVSLICSSLSYMTNLSKYSCRCFKLYSKLREKTILDDLNFMQKNAK